MADKLPEIPAAAKAEVDRNLALLDTQIKEAGDRLAKSEGEGGANFVKNAILGPLADKRAATIERIAIAIGRVAERPTGLEDLATCTVSDAAASPSASPSAASPAAIGPTADDFIDIQDVPTVEQPETSRHGSWGTFVSQCGTNAEGHSNTDNVIGAPGVPGGAQLTNDYVGNVSTDALSTNESLVAADTTCRLYADKSTYFWPTLRIRGPDDAVVAAETSAPEASPSATGSSTATATETGSPTAAADSGASSTDALGGTDDTVDIDAVGTDPLDLGPGADAGTDANASPSTSSSADPNASPSSSPSAEPSAGPDVVADAAETNIGTSVQPSLVRLQYRGNPRSLVRAAPRFLRMLTGDALAARNAGDNARPTWTCTGFTDRLTAKYPLCPDDSHLVRILDMPSCWDGQNLDSPDHRAHLVFPDTSGACPRGTHAVPQLRITLVYADVPNTQPDGANVPFALDSAPSESHNPSTDHAGAIGVMSRQLMRIVVRCINSGSRCH
ncbi:DUF1996 domain-containing protein [Streptosporangiaceae bacterium NEAU-GS5]|nr:DUF1996 domain-containing protein [Streptosporangiaceae bacterium NEAU-GS5]